MAQTVGFTGSRKGFPVKQLVKVIALSVRQAGHSVVVGCASGVDATVRQFCPQAQVFKVAAPGAGSPVSVAQALARRSQAMVQACSVLVGFASVACPPGVCPSNHFSGGGSGTWASIAYAVSQGVQVFVFPAAGVSLPLWSGGVSLPLWSGGQWLPAAPSGLWSQAFTWQPSATQLSLL